MNSSSVVKGVWSFLPAWRLFVRAIAVAGMLTVLTRCTPTPQRRTGGVPVVEPEPSLSAEAIARICADVDSTAGGPRLGNFMMTIGWVHGCIPMYTDDQRFNDGAGNFGPLAHIAPAPNDSYPDAAQFDVPIDQSILVGYVYVEAPETATLPLTYTTLRLAPGFNCVFFRHDVGVDPFSGWHGYVTRMSMLNTCPRPTVDQELRVFAIHDPNFSASANYPAVGRFREATYAARMHWPLLGLKCAAAFCLVSGDSGNTDPHRSEHRGVRPDRAWQVFGWNDEQHVALGGPSSGPQPQWNFDASIIAAEDLGTKTMADFADTVHVATVFLRKNPPAGSKYETTWHYAKDDNYILLHHDSTQSDDDGWSGVLRHHLVPTLWDKVKHAVFGTPYQWPLKVTRKAHGVPMPATARFKWSLSDESDWARCDQGCCEILPAIE